MTDESLYGGMHQARFDKERQAEEAVSSPSFAALLRAVTIVVPSDSRLCYAGTGNEGQQRVRERLQGGEYVR